MSSLRGEVLCFFIAPLLLMLLNLSLSDLADSLFTLLRSSLRFNIFPSFCSYCCFIIIVLLIISSFENELSSCMNLASLFPPLDITTLSLLTKAPLNLICEYSSEAVLFIALVDLFLLILLFFYFFKFISCLLLLGNISCRCCTLLLLLLFDNISLLATAEVWIAL